MWAAQDEAADVVGAMLVEEWPYGVAVRMRAKVAEAIPVMVRCLAPEQTYHFEVPADLCDALLAALVEGTCGEVDPTFGIFPYGLRLFDAPGEVRQLTLADRQLTDRYPPHRGEHAPSLSRLVEWAEEHGRSVVFAAIAEGEIVSYVDFGRVVDNLWEMGYMHTREEYRGRGFAKAVLSHASAYLLEHSILPLYHDSVHNVASIRAAQAVGYREAFRSVSCRGRPRTS